MKRNGYTLVELLAVIVIISILLGVGVYCYSSYIKSSRQKAEEIEEGRLIDAGSMYYREFENTDQYVSYVEDDVKYSCISVQSLIDMGYYNGDVSFLNEELTRDNTVIKVKEIDGVANYELVTDYSPDSDCVYYDFSSDLGDDTEIVMNNKDDNNNEISLSSTITKSSSDKNSYILKLKFSADVYEKIASYSVPLYVLEVLDTSGSMSGSKYSNAVAASISLSNSLIGKFNDSYVGLINFSTNAVLKRKFSHDILSTSNFNSADGITNILDALDMAYKEMSKVTVDESGIEPLKYVILLTDGIPVVDSYSDPCYSSYSNTCANALKNRSKKLKDDLNANLVVIGYEFNYDIYKSIASIDSTGSICPDSDYTYNGNKYCYYSSNSSNISNLFDSISNSIEKTVKSQSISKSEINVDFDKSIKIYDMDGNEVDNLNITINFDDDNKDVSDIEYEYLISLDNLDDDIFECNSNYECSYTSNLFDNFYINLYDMDGNILNKLDIGSSSEITIIRKLKSYIN